MLPSEAAIISVASVSAIFFFLPNDFWKDPNPINSYWAGFSAADACIEKRQNNHYSYHLFLGMEDKIHIQRFIYDCGHTGKIEQRKTSSRGKISSACGVRINNDKWGLDLKTVFNLEPNKTYRLGCPNLGGDYLHLCWLIGYTCGDGCIKYNPQGFPSISYVSSSRSVLEWIKNITERLFPYKLRNRQNNITKDSVYNSWHYVINGIQAAIMIDYLRHFPIPKLIRKWEKPFILRLIEEKYKAKWPHLFEQFNKENTVKIPLISPIQVL